MTRLIPMSDNASMEQQPLKKSERTLGMERSHAPYMDATPPSTSEMSLGVQEHIKARLRVVRYLSDGRQLAVSFQRDDSEQVLSLKNGEFYHELEPVEHHEEWCLELAHAASQFKISLIMSISCNYGDSKTPVVIFVRKKGATPEASGSACSDGIKIGNLRLTAWGEEEEDGLCVCVKLAFLGSDVPVVVPCNYETLYRSCSSTEGSEGSEDSEGFELQLQRKGASPES